MSGIINVLKPPGMTSHDVVKHLRWLLKVKKTGHTGTLDPGVAGVLPVAIGKATKIIEYMANNSKQYRAEITLGRSTYTQDGFGETIRVADATSIREQDAVAALLSMKGRQDQIPPMVSAIKLQGKKLYELARAGIEVPREPRTIHIHEIELISSTGFGNTNPTMLFDIKCSKGTYVRTICHDLGENLGCGGFMSFLVRTGAGRFHITEALTLEEITELVHQNIIRQALLPIDRALTFEPVSIYDDYVKPVLHGNRIPQSGVSEMPEHLVRDRLVKIMNQTTGCLAVARVLIDEQSVESGYSFQPVKVFY